MKLVRRLAALLAGCVTGAIAAPTIEGCPTLPANNIWNTRVDTLPVHERSAQYVANVNTAGTGAGRPFVSKNAANDPASSVAEEITSFRLFRCASSRFK